MVFGNYLFPYMKKKMEKPSDDIRKVISVSCKMRFDVSGEASSTLLTLFCPENYSMYSATEFSLHVAFKGRSS